MTDTYAVVLSGGSGTRLWPLTRQSKPKFMLEIDGTSLLSATIERALMLVSPDHVVCITSAEQFDAVNSVATEFGVTRIIIEPHPRDTTAAVFLAVATVMRDDPSARFISLPADHHIHDSPGWARAMQVALNARDSAVATIGVVPNRPATEYGYIETSSRSATATPVVAFYEKPTAPVAEEYLARGTFLWNTAMMCFSGRTFVDALRLEYSPLVDELFASLDENGVADPERWQRIPAVALEHSLMEPAARAGRVDVVAADIGWVDVGTWSSIPEAMQNSTRLASTSPNVKLIASPSAQGRRYAVAGIDDLFIVEMDDVTLITNSTGSADLKKLVASLDERGWHELL